MPKEESKRQRRTAEPRSTMTCGALMTPKTDTSSIAPPDFTEGTIIVVPHVANIHIRKLRVAILDDADAARNVSQSVPEAVR